MKRELGIAFVMLIVVPMIAVGFINMGEGIAKLKRVPMEKKVFCPDGKEMAEYLLYEPVSTTLGTVYMEVPVFKCLNKE